MCYQPITIKTPDGYRTVPCGRCLECLKKYQQDWSNRMYEELKTHGGKAVVFTLTYDDNNVPKNYLYCYDAFHYEIFRSPSDYGYDNTYTDEKGKERVLPARRGERKHRAVSADIELRENGIDEKIIDWNIKRKEENKFRDKIQTLYGDYLRNFTTPVVRSWNSNITGDTDNSSIVWNDDNFDSQLFLDEASMDEDDFALLDDFTEALNDDDFGEEYEIQDMAMEDALDNQASIPSGKYLPSSFRPRPVIMINSVRKKDVQDWIKRARSRRRREALKTGEPEQEFTFFVTSEYGPRTLRPHYHGILFGVTAEETVDMKTDWIVHHGGVRIQWEDADLTKGDLSYASKYCSKGFFEHPLCAKNFFYPKPMLADDGTVIRAFTEYHSHSYERCIDIFNVDAPICDPTFHLMSKGLGIGWCETHKNLTDDFATIDFDYNDGTATITFVKECAPWEDDFNPDGKINSVGFSITPIKIKRQNTTKNYEETIRRFYERFKYFRSFKGKTFAYSVPRYYREKVLSDGLRCAFANFLQQANVEIYQQKLEELRLFNPMWETDEIVLAMEAQEREELVRRQQKLKDKMSKYYNKSKI